MDGRITKTSWIKRGAILWIAVILCTVSLGTVRADPGVVGEPGATTRNYFPIIYSDYDPSDIHYVITRQHQGFDACHLPSVDVMQTWWNKSPYYSYAVYLGGSALYYECNTLSSTWLSQVDSQGWTFIPVWVGPQAPCYGYKVAMASDANTAYQQGRGEADKAVSKAKSLGFPNDLIIYYDLEYYPSSIVACRNTVTSFISGWVGRLHELDVTAGIYGLAEVYYSADITNHPDYLWLACYSYSSYDASASAYGGDCLSEKYWPNHSRIRQYSDGHSETWGSKSVQIDNDVIDGVVQAYTQNGLKIYSANSLTATQAVSLPVDAIQLVNPEQGWAITDGELLRSNADGLDWEAITPSASGEDIGAMLDAYFLGPDNGWIAFQDQTDGRIQIQRTIDGGATWQGTFLDTTGLLPAADVTVEFQDALSGWVVVKLQTSSAFSQGVLCRTADGGVTWSALDLPMGGEVRFLDANRGWLAGGVGGGELSVTINGGTEWQPVELIDDDSGETQVFYGLPVFRDDRYGVLPVTVLETGQSRLDLYSTVDGGLSWALAETLPLDAEAASESSLSLNAITTGGWSIALPDRSWVMVGMGENGDLSVSVQPGTIPEGVVSLQFADAQIGWAQTWNGSCSGDKSSGAFSCRQQSGLMKTQDGGITWEALSPAQ